MAGRWGRRVIHFPNLPIKLLMPSKLENIKEFAIKTIPSASKIEIKRVLEGLYGFEVDNVRTLNMEGKKKKRGGIVFAKPDYKKAYVTLKQPLSLPSNLFPIGLVEEEKAMSNKQSKSSIVNEQEKKTHWLDRDRGDGFKPEKEDAAHVIPEREKRFPWSYVGSWKQM
ncbi:unnamed protein product [Victoria cruziana]